VNCCAAPSAIAGFCGAIEIETRATAVTVRLAEPLAEAEAALIVMDPVPTPVASPWLPAVLLTVATVPSEELQWTVAVTSCVLLSLKVPVAVNCWVVPDGMEAVAGATVMATSAAALTVKVAEPLVFPEVALIVVVPWAMLVARPALLMVATAVPLEFQVTEFVRSCVLLSLNVPVAVNCWVFPAAITGFAGFTAMETSVAGVTVSDVDPLTLAEVALMVVFPMATLVASPWLPALLLMVAKF